MSSGQKLPGLGSGGGGSLGPISEAQLAQLWRRRAARSRALRTEGGRRVLVLYPGRPGVTAGPDFRNALLLVEGAGLVQGDVELHLRQGDWRAHGHHSDPNYNGVALHAALYPDAGRAAHTDGGAVPPVVGVRSLVDEAGGDADEDGGVRARLWGLLEGCGYRRPQSREQMAALLNRAGDERFLQHSRRFQTLLAAQSGAPERGLWEQALWEAIGEGLGYRHNRHPFWRLAGAAPVGILARAARRLPAGQRGPALSGWLRHLAGFDGDGGAGDGSGDVPPLPDGVGTPLDAGEWRLFRVRPSNHPRRRAAGAAGLVRRFADCGGSGSGLAAGLERAALSGSPARLTAALTVTAAEVGVSIGSDGGKGKGPALIGTGRARELAVNAVLPFLHAGRSLAGDGAGALGLLDLYRRYGSAGDNEITRALAASLQAPDWGRVADNARRQQGLLHLQRRLAGAG